MEQDTHPEAPMPQSDHAAWIKDALLRFQAPLLRYAAGITRDRELAADVVQDTFLRLLAAPRESVEGRLAPWLYRVCRNRAIDVCRKEERVRTPVDLAPPPEPMEPALAAERSETAARALQLVERLPEKQREVLRLKFQAGLSYAQIAEVTSLSVSHVGVLLHTAMKTLRGRLGALAPDA